MPLAVENLTTKPKDRIHLRFLFFGIFRNFADAMYMSSEQSSPLDAVDCSEEMLRQQLLMP